MKNQDKTKDQFIKELKELRQQLTKCELSGNEHSRVLDKLKESEERYRMLFESANDVIFLIDNRGKILEVNQKLTELTGYIREELVGKNIRKLTHIVPKKGLAVIISNFMKRMAGINMPPYEVELFNKKRELINAEINAVAIKKNGKIVGDLAIVRDITERKQAEEALRESEEEFRLTFENAKDAIFWADSETGLITNCNKAAEILLERKKQEIIGFHQTKLHPLQKAQNYANMFKKHIEQEGAVDDEAEIVTKSGKIRPVHITASVTVVGGKAIIQGIFRDITERKHAEEALRESEEKYRAVVKQSADNIYLLDIETKRVLESNAALQKLLGYSAEELNKLKVYDFVAHTEEDISQKIKKVMKVKSSFIGERKYRRKNDSIVDVEVSANFITLRGKKVLFVVSRDITERKRVENALKESEEKYKTLTENINVGIYRNTVGPKGEFIEVNPAIIKMFDYNNKAEFLALNVADLYQDPKDRKKFNKKMLHQEFVKSEELKFKKKNGTLFIGSVSAVAVKNEKGEIKYYDGMVEDITERKRTEEQLAHMATHDPLTGLPNRILFKDRLEQALRHAHRKDQNLAVMLLDLDHFKNINDTLGHSVGDQLLHQVASRLINTLRKGDTVGRMGGDEFMLLLPEIIREEYATTVAKKILEAIRKLFVFDGYTLNVTTSIGIALYPHDAENGEMLMRNADIAMYRAKDKGRNDYQRYSPTFNTHNK